MALALATIVSLGVRPASASACEASNRTEFGLSPGCVDVRIASAPGAGDLAPDFFAAGGHPYEVVASMRVNASSDEETRFGAYWPTEPLKDFDLSFPAGLVADPTAVPPCGIEQLSGQNPNCPPASQVGVVTLDTTVFRSPEPTVIELPLYLLESPSGGAPKFGFDAVGTPLILDASVSSTGRLAVQIKNINEVLTPVGIKISLWGVPADPLHTSERACPGQDPPFPGLLSGIGPSCAAGIPPRAFLRVPTSCAGPQAFSFAVDSWYHPGAFQTETVETHESPGLLGDPAAPASYPAPYPGLAAGQWGSPRGFGECGNVPFGPSVEAQAGRDAASGQSGLDVEVSMPQTGLEEPEAVSESDLESGSVVLPQAFALNPSVANGLAFCTPAEAGIGSEAPASCPDAAKLGTVELGTPLLPQPLTGSIYAAEPTGKATSSTTIPTYIVASADGVSIKLPSQVSVDPGDGRLRASFGPIPQLPLSRIGLHFFGGERAPFVVAPACGGHPLEAELDPWSGAPSARVSAAVQFSAGSGCSGAPSPRPFAPRFSVAVANPQAGATDALGIKLTRGDGEGEPTSLHLALPRGLAAAVGNVATCADSTIEAAEAQAPAAVPACSADAQVGEISAVVGAGSEPLHLGGGKVYLGGPYQGAGFSFVAGLPISLGRVQLGALSIRLPLQVDPRDGHLTIAGGLPPAPAGIALNLRELLIKVDRPGFLVNPTNCGPSTVDGQIDGDGGATETVSSSLGIVGCEQLRFRPRVKVTALAGPGATRHGGHPALRMSFSRPAGDANFAGTVITLPGTEQLDPENLGKSCHVAISACPASSIYGHVRAVSPLFSKPLGGPVYLHRSSHRFPDLIAALRGPLDVDLKGTLGFAGGRMLVRMGSIPDLPVSHLRLTVSGGEHGLLVNNRDLCRSASFAAAAVTAQNGDAVRRRTKLGLPCGADKN
ncbi:MAG TPA: hypothetical protein VHZ54_10835 [Solirubrobacterales bacterium]|nr:hypothetical protein [Solirubrobacterales bacterium]